MIPKLLPVLMLGSLLCAQSATADTPYLLIYCGPALALTQASNPEKALSEGALAGLRADGSLPFEAVTVVSARGAQVVLSASRLQCFDRGCDGLFVIQIDEVLEASKVFRIDAASSLYIQTDYKNTDECGADNDLTLASWDDIRLVTATETVKAILGKSLKCKDFDFSVSHNNAVNRGIVRTELNKDWGDASCLNSSQAVRDTNSLLKSDVAVDISPRELRRRILREEAVD